jgi:decaprenyl-diphosphate synthase subunit 1
LDVVSHVILLQKFVPPLASVKRLLLFQYPELNAMIMRRFQEPGDAERAFELVHKSQGLEQTRFLAKKHCLEATRLAGKIAESPYQKSLLVVPDLIVNRMK